ncbi:MAG TPA: hypothetical protein VMF88_00635 [Bacteroidota bacterium]|nr:hypothetical protein [Bacteroidota bacterium]
MPVHYRYDENIVIVEPVGEYSTEELRAAVLNAFTDAHCPASCCLLINIGQSRSIYNRSTSEINIMARFLASQSKRFNDRVAFAASDDAQFGLLRMGSIGAEEKGIQFGVFRSIDEARKWLLSVN